MSKFTDFYSDDGNFKYSKNKKKVNKQKRNKVRNYLKSISSIQDIDEDMKDEIENLDNE